MLTPKYKLGDAFMFTCRDHMWDGIVHVVTHIKVDKGTASIQYRVRAERHPDPDTEPFDEWFEETSMDSDLWIKVRAPVPKFRSVREAQEWLTAGATA